MPDDLLPNYRKPVGDAGRVVIEKMYRGHDSMTRAFVDVLRPGPEDVVLDVGCGGGLALSLFAAKAGRVYGIDYSDVSVEAAESFNRDAVRQGIVVVQRSDVLGMSFPDGMFSLVTAIETVYFWEQIQDCYARIRRALRPGGRFAILTEAWRDGEQVVNKPEHQDVLRLALYSPQEFGDALRQAGFATVTAREITDSRTLCVIATA